MITVDRLRLRIEILEDQIATTAFAKAQLQERLQDRIEKLKMEIRHQEGTCAICNSGSKAHWSGT